MKLRGSALGVLALVLAACATDADDGDASTDDMSEDELVATFDRRGSIDLNKTSRILLVGDSSHLGELPLYAATTKARRYAQLYPNDQIVLFVDEIERLVERVERGVGIPERVELQAGHADARHRVVGPECSELAVLCERGFVLALGIRNGGGERDDVRILAVDLGTTLETGFCFLEIAVFECRKAAIEIR